MRMRRIVLAATALTVYAAVVFTPVASTAAACVPNSIYVPPCGGWHRVTPGVQTLSAFESTIGRKVQMLREFKHFQSYDEVGERFPGPSAQAAIDGARMYVWSWRPQPIGSSLYLSWADIAAGRYDSNIIDRTADKVKAWSQSHGGKKTFMIFHHEPEPSRGTAADYAAAWRHIHDRFVARGARQYVIFTWVMTGYKTRVNQWGPMYPGDSYVDWIGYDPYQRVCANADTPGPLPNVTTTFGEATGTDVDNTGKYRLYKWATGAGAVDVEDGATYVKPGSRTKPIMIAEYGAYYGSDHPTAMEAFFKEQRTLLDSGRYPQIKAFVYFQGSSCTRVDSTAGSKAAYRNLVAIPRLNQPKPY